MILICFSTRGDLGLPDSFLVRVCSFPYTFSGPILNFETIWYFCLSCLCCWMVCCSVLFLSFVINAAYHLQTSATSSFKVHPCCGSCLWVTYLFSPKCECITICSCWWTFRSVDLLLLNREGRVEEALLISILAIAFFCMYACIQVVCRCLKCPGSGITRPSGIP